MKLIQSNFDNFRCFKQYKINYGTDSTVFIGKNGTGKSSVMSAIRRGLSIFFADSKAFSKNLNFSNEAKVQKYLVKDFNYNYLERLFETGIETTFKAILNDKTINWTLAQTKLNTTPNSDLYLEATNALLKQYNDNALNALPLFAVYSDNFPHVKAKISKQYKELIQLDSIPRDFGYFKWDQKESIIELWLNRYIKIVNIDKDLKDDIKAMEDQILLLDKRLYTEEVKDKNKESTWKQEIDSLEKRIQALRNNKNKDQFAKERRYIEDIFIKFTMPLSEEYEFINKEFQIHSLSVNRPDKTAFELTFNFADTRSIMFDTLPMGYKRIFSIVLDLAYRSYILNEENGSEGIVLIDEIGLHLHPTLQQEILQRLKNTFPNIQFIVTTHSPLVISNFKVDENNKIVKLEQVGNVYSNETIDNIYGIDYNTGLTEIMGANYRKTEIDNLIDSVVILTKFDKIEEANKIRSELQKIVGQNNKYIQIEINKRLLQNK